MAVSLAQAFAEQSRGRFSLTLAGPADRLHDLGAHRWGDPGTEIPIVDWNADRYSPAAELQWGRVRRFVGAEATWYFPHWDVPWHGFPDRSVVTVHDLGHLRLANVSRLRRAVARRWIRRATRRASRITADTRFTRGELLAAWPDLAGKVTLLPMGVDELFFAEPKPLPVAVASRLPGSPFMLSVGNLKEHKNLLMGPEVLSRIPSLRWVVVGEEFPDWRHVSARARSLEVDTRIVLLGRQSDDVLHALYNQAACLFFPSRHEGFGLPILEALAAGTPVVSGNADASVETLADAGWICDVDDPDAFARAVRQVLADGRGDGSRRRMRAREFAWASSAATLASIIESVNAND